MERLRVLVVDDEEEFVFTLVERLEMRDIEAEGVTHGREALARLQDKEYDVILLDVKMPGIGGLEVIKKIKSEHPKAQVVLLTGHGSAEDAREGIELGAFKYLMKPVNIDDLIQIFQNASEKREAIKEHIEDKGDTLHKKNLAFMGTITASLSHEINNVITIINELSGLLDDLIKPGRAIENEKLKGISEKISKHVGRGESFIKLLNRFAHSADQPIATIETSELLEQITALCKRFANLKRVNLEAEPVEKSLKIETNPLVLQHAIYLCIDMALNVTARDKTIATSCGAQETGCIFSVKTPDEVKRNARTDERMSLLSLLVRELSGRSEFSSSEKMGSVFSLFLPGKVSG